MKNVCIINYNTPRLVKVAIESLLQHTPDCKVTVFDNFTIEPFRGMNGVDVIDNTKGQIIDFNAFHQQFPEREPDKSSGYGSPDHIRTVQELWKYFPDGFVLMDSDVIVTKDISPLFDNSVAYVGDTQPVNDSRSPNRRVRPFICYINVKMCVEAGVTYYNKDKCWCLTHKRSVWKRKEWWDTGTSFLYDCIAANLKGREIRCADYVIHLGGGSYRNKHKIKEFINKYYNANGTVR